MNTIKQRLTAAFTAAIASAVTLGATLVLFASPAHADEAARVTPGVVGGVAAAQRYRAVQPTAADVKLDLRAGTTADVRALARQTEARTLSNEAGFRASNEAGFRASNEAGFRASNEAGFRASNEAGFRASNEAGFRASNEAGFRASNEAGFRASNEAGFRP